MSHSNCIRSFLTTVTIFGMTSSYGQSELSAPGGIIQSGPNNKGTVVNNPCTVEQKNLTVNNGSTIINDLHCHVSPEKSVDLRYVWLDAESASFLFAGIVPSPIRRLLGVSPSVVHNEVYDEMKGIIKKFGELKDPHEMDPGSDPTFVIGNQSVYDQMADYGNNAVTIAPTKKDYSVLRKAIGMRIFHNAERIPWPYPVSTLTILTTKHWPEDYSMHYTPDIDFSISSRSERDNTVISCTSLYSFLSRERFNNYWPDMNTLLERVDSHTMYIRETGFDNKKVFKDKNFDSKSRAALGYFGEQTWPDDFEVGYYMRTCATIV